MAGLADSAELRLDTGDLLTFSHYTFEWPQECYIYLEEGGDMWIKHFQPSFRN
jgi:hypothetical protein